MAAKESTKPEQGSAIERAEPDPPERHAVNVAGPLTELLRAITLAYGTFQSGGGSR